MVNLTLAIPEDLKREMEKFPEINWSEIARRAMTAHAMKLKLMEKIVEKSKFTEKDVEELDHKIKAGLLKRFSK